MCRRVCARCKYTHSCTMSVWITLLFQIQPNTIKRWLMTIVGYFLFLLSNNKSYNLRFCWRLKQKNWEKLEVCFLSYFKKKFFVFGLWSIFIWLMQRFFLCTQVSYSCTSNKDLVCVIYIWSNYFYSDLIHSKSLNH